MLLDWNWFCDGSMENIIDVDVIEKLEKKMVGSIEKKKNCRKNTSISI